MITTNKKAFGFVVSVFCLLLIIIGIVIVYHYFVFESVIISYSDRWFNVIEPLSYYSLNTTILSSESVAVVYDGQTDEPLKEYVLNTQYSDYSIEQVEFFESDFVSPYSSDIFEGEANPYNYETDSDELEWVNNDSE